MKIAAEGFSCISSIHLTSAVHRDLPVVAPPLRPGDERASYVSKNSILLEHHPSNGGERAT